MRHNPALEYTTRTLTTNATLADCLQRAVTHSDEQQRSARHEPEWLISRLGNTAARGSPTASKLSSKCSHLRASSADKSDWKPHRCGRNSGRVVSSLYEHAI